MVSVNGPFVTRVGLLLLAGGHDATKLVRLHCQTVASTPSSTPSRPPQVSFLQVPPAWSLLDTSGACKPAGDDGPLPAK